MKLREGAKCKACRSGKLCKSEVSQKFEREGLEIEIDGIPAFVCEDWGQAYFLPGVGDKISVAANDLFKLVEVKRVSKFKAVV